MSEGRDLYITQNDPRARWLNLRTENWKEAQSDFFESFRSYDEAGSLQRIQVLRYLVLTTMLMESDINPFDSQETKPYKDDPRISAMNGLVDAYQRDDIHGYEKILQNNKDLLADPFIAENIDEVTRNMRTKAVVKLVAPYTRFTLAFISRQLKISLPEVQDLVGFLIVDKRLRAKINQRDGTVEVESSTDQERVQAMRDWSAAIEALATSVLENSEGWKQEEGLMGGGGMGTLDDVGTIARPGKSTNGFAKALRGGAKKVGKPVGAK